MFKHQPNKVTIALGRPMNPITHHDLPEGLLINDYHRERFNSCLSENP